VASRIDQNSNSHFDLQFRESESESESERERAPLRVLRSLVSVCLGCLAAVVVAHRVPPPVSARSGRSFFSLARGPGAAVVARIVGTLLGASALSFRLWLNRGWGSQFVELKVP
jgi:hypothetical protein